MTQENKPADKVAREDHPIVTGDPKSKQPNRHDNQPAYSGSGKDGDMDRNERRVPSDKNSDSRRTADADTFEKPSEGKSHSVERDSHR